MAEGSKGKRSSATTNPGSGWAQEARTNMNGLHFLLLICLVLAIAEIIYTQNRLQDSRRRFQVVRRERDAARARIGVRPNVSLVHPGSAHPVCESCGNEDATFVVCTDCMTMMPDVPEWTL